MKNKILLKRGKLIKKNKFTVLRIFDTFGKEGERKDVILCQRRDGIKVILRIGEVRPKIFFPQGYIGKYLVIPKILKRDFKDPPYEIEEYMEGKLISDAIRQRKDGRIDLEILKKLLNVFWEFQKVAKNLKLKHKFSKAKILEHFNKGLPFIRFPKDVKNIIDKNESFWNERWPSKWKFSPDNLILLAKNEKIAFIDNSKVGARFWGYDLGWLIWPLWPTMTTKNYSNISSYWKYLEKFKTMLIKQSPSYWSKKIDLQKMFYLIVFERLIGALFDVSRNVSYLADWGLSKNDAFFRRKEYIKFLNKILEKIISKLKI